MLWWRHHVIWIYPYPSALLHNYYVVVDIGPQSADYPAKSLQYRPRRLFSTGENKMTIVTFSYPITSYRTITNALSCAIKRVQQLCNLQIYPQRNPQKMYGGKIWSQLSWLHRTWRQGLHRLVIWGHACYGTGNHLHHREYREIWWLIPTPDACFWLISLVFNVIIDLVFEKMSFWNEYRQIHSNKNIGHFADWCYVFLFLSITT